MEQTLEKKIEEILRRFMTDQALSQKAAKALVIFIEQEKKDAFWAGRLPTDTGFQLLPSATFEYEYKDYESYSLKKGEEETERGLG